MAVGSILSSVPPAAVYSAEAGLGAAFLVSLANQRFIKHPLGGTVAAILFGSSLILPAAFIGRNERPQKKPRDDYSPLNSRNLLGIALMLGQYLLFCHQPNRAGGHLYLGSRFGIVGPLLIAFLSEGMNQCVAGRRPFKEIDLLPVGFFSLISCYFGLGAKGLSALERVFSRKIPGWLTPLRMGTGDFGLLSGRGWFRTGLYNSVLSVGSIPFQGVWAAANGQDREEAWEVTKEVVFLNLVFGTCNERFIYRNYQPHYGRAIASRLAVIGGVFAGYFRWWKKEGIHKA
ncbi:MAG: hypothetical protein HYY44_05215 [Deltaproteobacteria bacterium]|nr:hypothetical protein [Deltaproteobacteria bacterium]MBI4374457.1 hypothetical protein [Deltaproteobacteria bacterium]